MKKTASMSEIFFGRVGFALLCGIGGLAYGLATSVVIFMVFKKLSVFHIVKVFVYVFSATGFVFGPATQKLIESMFYPMAFLVGAAFAETANVIPEAVVGSNTKASVPNGLVIAALLGFISIIICFVSW